MKIFPFPRRLPFKIEIAPGYIKFPRYRSNYRCRRYIKFAPPSKFPLLNSNPRISIPIPTFEKLKRSRFIDRDHRSSSFLPSLEKKGRFNSVGEKERVGSRIRARVNVDPFGGLSAAVHPSRDPLLACPRAAVMSTLIITAKAPSPNCSRDRIARVKGKETKPRSLRCEKDLIFLSRRCLLLFPNFLLHSLFFFLSWKKHKIWKQVFFTIKKFFFSRFGFLERV